MKRRALSAATLALAAAFALAAISLNSSRSNIYRLTYSTALVTAAQASAILADLDKMPRMDDAKLQQALREALSKRGIDPARVKKMLIRRDKEGKPSIILLDSDRPEDERAAIAVSDPGTPSDKPAKKGGTSKN